MLFFGEDLERGEVEGTRGRFIKKNLKKDFFHLKFSINHFQSFSMSVSIFDPHSLFSIVEAHITQHLSNINVNETLSKILQIDEIGSSVNDSISLSLSTQPTGETPLSSLCIVKCENSKEYNVVRDIIKSWLKRTGNEYYVILCLTGFGV